MLWVGRHRKWRPPGPKSSKSAGQLSLTSNKTATSTLTDPNSESELHKPAPRRGKDRLHLARTASSRLRPGPDISEALLAAVPSKRVNNASRSSRKSQRLPKSTSENELHQPAQIAGVPNSLTTSHPDSARIPSPISSGDHSPKRKRSRPSKYFDSENYNFRLAKRVRTPRLTPSPSEVAEVPDMQRSTTNPLPGWVHPSEDPKGTTERPNAAERFITIDSSDDGDDDPDFQSQGDGSDENAGEAAMPPNVLARFTADEAEKLLPSPFFPHVAWVKRNYWNEEDEADMQRRFGFWADGLATYAANQNAELGLWKGMLQLYGRTPFDLYRYGLKVDSRPVRFIEIQNRRYINVNMNQELCTALSTLMCHPIWHNDIGLLRFALQFAVSCRIEGHIAPLPAVLDVMANDTQDRFIQNILKMQNDDEIPQEKWCKVVGDFYYHSLDHGGPNANFDLKELFAQLKKDVKPKLAVSEQEKMIFLLRVCDVQAIITALDSLEVYSMKKWQPTEAYYNARTNGQRKRTKIFPPSKSTLQQWKKACFLHELREKLIRRKLREDGKPDNLLDFPETDPIPFYILSKHVTEGQRAVIRGVVYPADEEQLPPPTKTDSMSA